MNIVANPAQARFMHCIKNYPRCTAFFFVAGFGTGKSYFDVIHILELAYRYRDTPITIGVGSSTMKRLRQSLLLDLTNVLKQSGIPYSYNKMDGEMQIGSLTIIILNLEQYEDIFALNFVCCILDELDTLPTEKSVGAFTKCQERTRKVFPDGRDPYIVVSTTANGLKGTYMLYEKLKEQGVHCILARGSTHENPYFSKTSLKMLEALYNEKEKEAYLHGKFINLSTGRVYPEFDEMVHTYMTFPASMKDIIYCGMDMNSGYNSNTVFVIRQEKVFLVEEFRCEVAGDVMRIIRNKYPMNRIIAVPDASAKEILRGYLEEADQNKVELQIPMHNPGIAERVLVVNKLFRTKRLYIQEHCKEVVKGLKLRGFDDKGEPDKGRGEYALDHYMDSLEYALFYIIHTQSGFEQLIELIKFQGGRDDYKLIGNEHLKTYAGFSKERKKNGTFDRHTAGA